MKKLLILIFCLTLNINIFAANPKQNLTAQDKEIFKALQDEMTRNLKELKMDNFAVPYFLTYKLEPFTRYIFGANQGALTRSSKMFYPKHNISVRVGSAKEDNSFFLPAVRLPQQEEITFPLTYEGIRKAFWQITDGAYKNALAELTEKQAYKKNKNISNKQGDFSFYPAQEVYETLTQPQVDASYWQQMAKETSLEGVSKDIDEFKTSVIITFRPAYLLTSRGSKYLQDRYSVEIIFMAKSRLEDGFEFNLNKTLTYVDFKDVPSLTELKQKAADFAKEIISFRKAKKAPAYIGPVLLEGAQALNLMQVLQREISFANPIHSNRGEISFEGSFTDKIGLKVLSSGLDVIDEPLLKTFAGKKLAGSYEVDEEGVKAEKLQIIENGILKTLPYGASLTKNNKKSNGHARAYFEVSGAFAMPSNLILLARKTTPQEDFVKEFRTFCAEQGLKECPIIAARDTENGIFFGYMVDAQSGKETAIYGELTPFNARSLRDIKYASDNLQVYNIINNREKLSLIVPDLILDNGEISPTKKQPARKPLVQKP